MFLGSWAVHSPLYCTQPFSWHYKPVSQSVKVVLEKSACRFCQNTYYFCSAKFFFQVRFCKWYAPKWAGNLAVTVRLKVKMTTKSILSLSENFRLPFLKTRSALNVIREAQHMWTWPLDHLCALNARGCCKFFELFLN